MAFRSGRPIYAIVMLALSSLFMCATFLPPLYSVLLPNQDIQQVVAALEDRGNPPAEAAAVVQQATTVLGNLTRAIKIGVYFGGSATFQLGGGRAPEKIRVSQATYVAWFERRSKPMLVAITRYERDDGQKSYRISEGESSSVVRGYLLPIFLFVVSLFLVRSRKSAAS